MVKFHKLKRPESQGTPGRFSASVLSLAFISLFLWPGWGFIIIPLPQFSGTLVSDSLLIAAAVFLGIRLLKIPGPGPLSPWDILWGLIAAIGLLALSSIFGILGKNLEWIPSQAPRIPSAGPQILVILGLVVSAVKEEFFFRWLLIKSFQAIPLKPLAVIILQGLLFALSHIYQGLWWTLFAFISGTLLGVLAIKLGRLWPCVGGHCLYNLAILIL